MLEVVFSDSAAGTMAVAIGHKGFLGGATSVIISDGTVSKEEILEGVWGFDTEVETRVTDETLRRIRRKLSLAGSNVSIGTIWGFGYRISIAEDKK